MLGSYTNQQHNVWRKGCACVRADAEAYLAVTRRIKSRWSKLRQLRQSTGDHKLLNRNLPYCDWNHTYAKFGNVLLLTSYLLPMLILRRGGRTLTKAKKSWICENRQNMFSDKKQNSSKRDIFKRFIWSDRQTDFDYF